MNDRIDHIRTVLQKVKDPEIPVLSIHDLGILRDVRFEGETCVVYITPSYVGCPAMKMIELYIKLCLEEEGIDNFRIETVLTPAWTTDWISEEGKKKLKEYGIAPPVASRMSSLMNDSGGIQCPRCDSEDTKQISFYGSTACKAQYQCNSCLEPFEYFKCH